MTPSSARKPQVKTISTPTPDLEQPASIRGSQIERLDVVNFTKAWNQYRVACKVENSNTQTFSNNSLTDVTLDEAVFDTTGGRMTDTANNAIVIPRNGIYLACFKIRRQPNSTGARFVRLETNGGSDAEHVIVLQAAASGEDTILEGNILHEFQEGDSLDMAARQESGGNLDSELASLWVLSI